MNLNINPQVVEGLVFFIFLVMLYYSEHMQSWLVSDK